MIQGCFSTVVHCPMQKCIGTGYRLPHVEPVSNTYLDAELVENWFTKPSYQLACSYLFFLSFILLIGWQLSIWNCCKPFFSLLYNCQLLAHYKTKKVVTSTHLVTLTHQAWGVILRESQCEHTAWHNCNATKFAAQNCYVEICPIS